MKSAEAQLWELALGKESRRVEKVHDEAKAKGKKTSVKFEPRNVMKPWSWEQNWKVSLHDIPPDLVLAVSAFDFDLEDGEFQAFLTTRGLRHLGGVPRSTYWQRMNDPTVDKGSFLSIEKFRYAQEYHGKRYKWRSPGGSPGWRRWRSWG